ncbi:PadR family transcriptional regulator [Actinopolymorpha pittospori]
MTRQMPPFVRVLPVAVPLAARAIRAASRSGWGHAYGPGAWAGQHGAGPYGAGHHGSGHHDPGHHEPGHHGPGHHEPGHHEAGHHEAGLGFGGPGFGGVGEGPHRGRGRGGRRGGGGFGPGGFGPGGFGPGGFGPWGGRGGWGPPFGFPGRGPRARRGDVRAGILHLLASTERPMHGYEMIRELQERSGGAWRPSAGSIYPTLQLLEDEGLVTSTEEGGKRLYSLTDAGREHVEGHGNAPWEEFVEPSDSPWHELRRAGMGLMAAAMQGAQAANEDQLHRIADTLREARSKIYRILGEDDRPDDAGDADDHSDHNSDDNNDTGTRR